MGLGQLKKMIMTSKLGALKKVIGEFLPESKLWIKYAYDNGMDKYASKMEVDLVIRAHALEKGMSIGKVKKDFGKEKTIALISDLQKYLNLGGKKIQVLDICGIIHQYLQFNGFNGSGNKVEKCFMEFCSRNSINLTENVSGGIKTINRTNDSVNFGFDFSSFSQSRYSIRDFSNTPIDQEKVKQALKICERTPSACNRQPWRIYVYYNKKQRESIFNAQNGVIGFAEDMQCAILVCCDMRCYNTGETNLPYTDGGLYGMNLLYALHYKGLAAIPLSVSYHKKRMKAIRIAAGIKDYEVPVLLVGVGTFKDTFKVAVSQRKEYKDYTTINC